MGTRGTPGSRTGHRVREREVGERALDQAQGLGRAFRAARRQRRAGQRVGDQPGAEVVPIRWTPVPGSAAASFPSIGPGPIWPMSRRALSGSHKARSESAGRLGLEPRTHGLKENRWSAKSALPAQMPRVDAREAQIAQGCGRCSSHESFHDIQTAPAGSVTLSDGDCRGTTRAEPPNGRLSGPDPPRWWPCIVGIIWLQGRR
jgi:hypothetical protein